MAGAWRRHEDTWNPLANMTWYAAPADGEKWALVVTKHRDSNNIDKSNAVVIEREICQRFPEDAHIESFSDWLVGWTEHLVLRVYDAQGGITEAFQSYDRLARKMENYPLLDEELYSEMDEGDVLHIVEMAIQQLDGVEMKAELPEGWVVEVRRQLDDYDSDIRGDDWWPNSDHLQAVLQELGYLAPAPVDEIEA